MDCSWCLNKFGTEDKIVWAGINTQYHQKCLDAKAEADRQRIQEAKDKAVDTAAEKWCPYSCGPPGLADDKDNCIATDCMAWDGYDCRRLQVPEVG